LEELIALNRARGVYFLFAQPAFGKIPVNPLVLSPSASVQKMLTQLLRKTGLYFRKVDDKTFVILDKKNRNGSDRRGWASGADDSTAVENVVPTPTAVAGLVTGRVTAVEGKPLEGVSVAIQHTQKGTATNQAGVFSMNADRDDTLVFSSVGFGTLKLKAAGVESDAVLMEPSNDPLAEVLVTAMGIRKQERALGYSATELDVGNATGGTIPRRYTYSTVEAATNATNYSAAVSGLTNGDKMSSRVWWDSQ
jgi:hypothetical protein